MNKISEISCAEKHAKKVAQYYRLQAPIYDVTRWSFLFGRKTLIDQIPSLRAQPTILEVGCGTGKNLIYLKQRFPDADITGIDLSTDMIGKAQKNITTPSISLKKMRYGSGKLKEETYDLILLSYTLTMMGAEYSHIVSRIKNNLNANGYLAVVDFHTSPFSWFRK
ncbi:MAG: methyltransferase domain-containing protein, partial [Aliifodinibius sp.]|nr:methyltransferase domain-containing protein [Fodinibius sp.]